MSPDQEPEDSGNDDIEKVLRDAEEAVDKVRSGDDEEADVIDLEEFDADSELATKLAEAEAEAVALKDKWLRALADHENYKKRVKRDVEDAVHRAVQGLLSNFLPVGDNLERALSVAPADASEQLAPLLKGLDMVRQEFFNALKKHGIKPIEAVGHPFDPNLHDALQQMDSTDYAPGTVTMEYEKGYMRGEKLLRAARVIVAGPGSTGTVGKPDEAETTEDAGSDAEAN